MVEVCAHSAASRMPDPRDGFAFLVQQLPAGIWLQERIAQTGEKLEIVQITK
jgi:hypothetical protein